MRIQIQHADAPAEMRDEVTEEEAQALADSGLVVLVAGRDGGYRQLAPNGSAETVAPDTQPAQELDSNVEVTDQAPTTDAPAEDAPEADKKPSLISRIFGG